MPKKTTRPRTSSKIPTPQDVSAGRRHTPNEQRTQTSRSVGPGTGVHRGDRRDTHPSFSTGKGGRGSTAGKARDGGRSGPKGASGRKSGPSPLEASAGSKARDVAKHTRKAK